MMPLSEHTGSHSSAEHEQSLLHSEKSISLSYDMLCVLRGKGSFYIFTLDFKKGEVEGLTVKNNRRKCRFQMIFVKATVLFTCPCIRVCGTDPLYETVRPATGMLSHLVPNCSRRRRYARKDVAKESWAPDTTLSLYRFISSPPRKIPTDTTGRFNTPGRGTLQWA